MESRKKTLMFLLALMVILAAGGFSAARTKSADKTTKEITYTFVTDSEEVMTIEISDSEGNHDEIELCDTCARVLMLHTEKLLRESNTEEESGEVSGETDQAEEVVEETGEAVEEKGEAADENESEASEDEISERGKLIWFGSIIVILLFILGFRRFLKGIENEREKKYKNKKMLESIRAEKKELEMKEEASRKQKKNVKPVTVELPKLQEKPVAEEEPEAEEMFSEEDLQDVDDETRIYVPEEERLDEREHFQNIRKELYGDHEISKQLLKEMAGFNLDNDQIREYMMQNTKEELNVKLENKNPKKAGLLMDGEQYLWIHPNRLVGTPDGEFTLEMVWYESNSIQYAFDIASEDGSSLHGDYIQVYDIEPAKAVMNKGGYYIKQKGKLLV